MQSSDDTIALPGFELDLAQSLLRDATGSEVRLRPQAMAVLEFLARNAGRVVTKDELMQSVWAGTVVTDDSLVQCVRGIRQPLKDHDHRIVRTSPKRDYWLAGASTMKADPGEQVALQHDHQGLNDRDVPDTVNSTFPADRLQPLDSVEKLPWQIADARLC